MDKNSRGFSMVEVLIASVLIASAGGLAMVGMVGAARMGSPGNTNAYLVAQKTLEGLHEAVRQDWWSVPGNPLSTGSRSNPSVALNGITFSRNYNVTDVVAGGRNYRKVEVTVSWTPAA